MLKKKKKHTKENDYKNLQKVLESLGDYYWQNEFFEKAQKEFEGYLATSKHLGDRLHEALAHRKIGEVLLDQEEFKESISHVNLYLGKS